MSLVTRINDNLIIWEGHACEGSNLGGHLDYSTFCLWTRCGAKDVPANAAHEGSAKEITCPKCVG